MFAFYLGHSMAQELTFVQQLNPIIASISPNFGSVEGGTAITITGANFRSAGLFTSHQVYVGGNVCEIIDYYSTNERIICKTPKCFAPACLARSFSNIVDVEVSVLVSTVQGILEDTSTFRYHSTFTPMIFKLFSDSTWGGDTSLMFGRFQSEFLADLDVKIGAQHADLGDDDELNPAVLGSRWNDHLQYRTPEDLEAGYYNISLTVSLVEAPPNSRGTGLARTFDDARYDWATDFYYDFYSYRSSLSGTVHSATVFPSVRSVSPRVGSIGGGTVLTIKGSGFSSVAEDLDVYAGGELCDIISSDLTTITCKTRAHPVSDDKTSLNEMMNAGQSQSAVSSRASGSPGWWVKMWDRFATEHTHETVKFMFGWRERMYLSLQRLVGSNWPNILPGWTDQHVMVMDAGAEFLAPYTGYYSFFYSTDDNGQLFASKDGVGVNEYVIAQSITWRADGDFYAEDGQRSDPIMLNQGERLYLRARNRNTGGYDQVTVSVEITPLYNTEGYLAESFTDAVENDLSAMEALAEANLPNRLLHHHAKREVQQFQISYNYAREIQLINITGLTDTANGDFRLVVQGYSQTKRIGLSSTNNEIALALRAAAEEISSAERECRFFSVTRIVGPDFVEIYVEFLEDRAFMTGLGIIDFSLKGPNQFKKVSLFRPHTPIPSGTFQLVIDGDISSPINYDASSTALELAIKSMNPGKFNVEVFSVGFAMNSRTWTITFITPAGNLDLLQLDTSGIINSDGMKSLTRDIRNGTTSTLMFDPIPPFMVATPVAWATGNETNSFVEVIKRSNVKRSVLKDSVKSVCAAPTEKSGDVIDRVLNNGDENNCAFSFSTASSAIVTSQEMTYINDYDVGIVVYGRDFDISDYTSLNQKVLTVRVGPKPCNISSFSATRIECTVTQVPWGDYDVDVYLEGFGYAVILAPVKLTFTQEITSVSEAFGSFLGGQRLVLEGRGFRSYDAQVLIGAEICEVTEASYDRIACVVPPANPYAEVGRRLSIPDPKYTQIRTVSAAFNSNLDSEAVNNERRKHMKNMLNQRDALKSPKMVKRFAEEAVKICGNRDVHSLNVAAHLNGVHYGSFPKRRELKTGDDLIHFLEAPEHAIEEYSVVGYVGDNLNYAEEEVVHDDVHDNSLGRELVTNVDALNKGKFLRSASRPETLDLLDAYSSDYSILSPFSNDFSQVIPVFSDAHSDHTLTGFSAEYSVQYYAYSVEYSVEPEPSGVPSTVPSAVPSLGLNFTEVEVSVDGMVASELYTYSIDVTPFLTMINPTTVSRATETNITFMGVGLGSDGSSEVEVLYGGEICRVFLSTDTMIKCTLDQGVLLDVVDATVVIYIPNIGYVAKSASAILLYPTVESGFQIYSISPNVGSLLGGTTIEINGFGFFSTVADDYNVKFAIDAVEVPSEYNILSSALGFAVDDSETLYCKVASASFHKIICNLDKTPLGVVVKDFSVAMGLNGAATACGSSDCLFTQSRAVTPKIIAANDVSINGSGYVFFNLEGTLLDEDGVIAVHLSKIPTEKDAAFGSHSGQHRRLDMDIIEGAMEMDPYTHLETMHDILDHTNNHMMTVNDIACWSEVFHNDSVSVSVVCPPVTAGRWNVSAFVASLGWVDTNGVTVLTDTEVTDVYVESSTGFGSIAGGLVTTISGYGFSPDCRENSGAFEILFDNGEASFSAKLSHHVGALHHFMDFISCTVTEIIVYTPSIVDHIPANEADLSSPTAYNYELKKVTISVNALDDNTDAIFESYFQMASAFKYSTQYTPAAVVTVPSGTKSSAPNYYVNLTCPIMMGESQTISFSRPSKGGRSMKFHVCPSVTTFKSGEILDHGILKYRAELSCSTPLLPAADYQVVIEVADLGRAHWGSNPPMVYKSLFDVQGMLNPMQTSFPDNIPGRVLTEETVEKIQSSIAGGQIVTIRGEGFSDEVAVSVCSQACTYIDSTYTSYQCVAPDRLTINSLADAEDMLKSMPDVHWNFGDIIKKVPGTPFGSSTSSAARAFDDNFETYFFHAQSNCFVGLRAESGFKIKPSSLNFYPRLQHAWNIEKTGAVFEGSLDGGSTFIELASIGLAHEGWNTVTPSNESAANQWFTHLRYREPVRVSSACNIAEMWFEGISASEYDDCDVLVGLMELTESEPVNVGVINYNMTASPMIFSLTPNNGTALGGTPVEIIGVNLLVTSEWPTVVLNGIECDVTSASETSVVCITRSRLVEEVNPFSIDMNVPGLGYAVSADSNLKFMYVDRWSAVTSWRNQRLPRAGDIVWIPEGQVIMLDIFSPQFLFVLVQGHLYFDRERDVSLDSTYIFVYGGYMEVGTADVPYEKSAIITLHGDRYVDIDMPMFGSKCLVVSALEAGTHTHHYNPLPHAPGPEMGQLEIHGQKRIRTWTKLSETAKAGDNFVVTAEPVDFKPGEIVVVPGTELPGGDDSSHPNYGVEVMTVLSNDDGHHVYFTEPLLYTHRSEIVTEEGRDIDLRCEIGLLTRNVVIRGDDRSHGQLFGVHVVGIMRSIFRIENAEVTLCGQAHSLGRYCTHSHVGMNMAGSYVKANSIHHSFQRTVTTHTTHHWEVRDNVGYDVMGHAYFVEFGDETYNHITGNLGILVKPNSAGLKSDHKPGVFWTANPTNFWSDNVGVHSRAWGFWFEFAGRKGAACPSTGHLGEFHNMTFRSNSAIGLRIYPVWTPQVDPCGPNTGPAPQYLRNMVSYRNGNLGLFTKKMGDLHHIGHSILENGGNEIHIVKFEHVPYNYNPAFLDILLIGTLNPPEHDFFNVGGFGIHAPQNDFFYIKNITFKNYGMAPAIATCNSCESGENFNQGGVQYRTEQLRFIRSSRRIKWMPHFKEIFRDIDGSLVDGPAESYVVRRYFFNDWPGICTLMNNLVFDYSTLCNQPVRTMRVDQTEPSQLDFTDLRITSTSGSDEVYFLPLHFYGWTIPLVVNQQYHFEWTDSQTSARKMRIGFGGRNEYLFEAIDVFNRNESARIAYTPYHYDYDAYSFQLNYGGDITIANVTVDIPQVPNFRMAASSYVNKTLKIDFSTFGSDRSLGENTFRVSAVPQLCPPAGCPVPPPYIAPSEYLLWTNVSIWPGHVLPVAGDNVVITADKWVVMDINPPALASVTVNGKLSFQRGRGAESNLTLVTGNLVIYGEFEIDFHNRTADGAANVVLNGDKQSSKPVLIGEGIFPGSKVIAVPGSLKVVGQKVEKTWLRLKITANFGDTSVVLDGLAKDWAVGDSVGFSPTAYFTRSGDAWYDADARDTNGVENRVISAISFNTNDGTTTIQFSEPLGATHLCIVDMEESFCGVVGLLSRNVRFLSRDSEDPVSSSYGFGGHVMVMDATMEDNAVGRDMTGTAHLEYVQLINFGKVNSDHYGIGYHYTSTDNRNTASGRNRVIGCVFDSGYNIGIQVLGTNGFKMDGNFIFRNWAGGVDIDFTSRNTTITNNVVIGSMQRPSILAGGYPWTTPMAAFSIKSSNMVQASGNIAAGSFDEGFSIATGALPLFAVGSPAAQAVCGVTRGEAYTDPASYLSSSTNIDNNEAVGCRSGYVLITVPSSSVRLNDCIVVRGVKVWRSGHVGLGGVDMRADILISGVVLAENPIGTSMSYFKVGAQNAFTGIVDSTIIGTFRNDGYSDSEDSLLSKQTCQAFSLSDPWGLQDNRCASVIGGLYRRVGFMLPQHTNGPKTCATAGRFRCRPSNVPDRMCGMPWQNRFGVPVSMLYAETHIHNVAFIGFRADDGVPSASFRSAAIAINPTQVDTQSTVVVSGLRWTEPGDSNKSPRMDEMARFGAEHGDRSCNGHWCLGLEMLVINDQDGSLARSSDMLTYTGGQLSLGGGVMTAPSPMCFPASHLGPSWQLCPSGATDRDDSVFRQYSAVWRDWGSDVIGPVLSTRYFRHGDNRTYPSYEPLDDMCALKMSYSRFPLLIASGGRTQKIQATGNVPSMWTIRWDAPSEDDVAIIEFLINEAGNAGSSAVDVLVGSSIDGPWTKVNKFSDRYPTKNDPAGSNTRNPQKRTLHTVMRGGSRNWYRFVVKPIVAVTMRMEMKIENFFAANFIVNIATLLGVGINQISIADVRQGSVIVDFSVEPNTTATEPAELTDQVLRLRQINDLLDQSLANGNLSRAMNTSILNFASSAPDIPVFFNEEANFTAPPSSFPTSSPSSVPSTDPTAVPSSAPTTDPSFQPTFSPTFAPTKRPTPLPTLAPTVFSSEAAVPDEDDSAEFYEEEYFLPAAIGAGIIIVAVTVIVLSYFCGMFGGCCGLFATVNKDRPGGDGNRGAHVVVGSGARTRRVSPPEAAASNMPPGHGGAPKRVVPTTSANRVPAHVTRTYDNAESQNSSGEGLFVSNRNELERTESVQTYISPAKNKPGAGHHHQLSLASDRTSLSFDEKITDVIRHDDSNLYNLGEPVQDQEVELYFDYGAQL